MDSADSAAKRDAGVLMESLLRSLLDDFDHWFQRGEQLLETCPLSVMGASEQAQLRARLQEGRKAVGATRALTAASSQPVAVSMEAMTPWHGLVTEVWGLASKVGRQSS